MIVDKISTLSTTASFDNVQVKLIQAVLMYVLGQEVPPLQELQVIMSEKIGVNLDLHEIDALLQQPLSTLSRLIMYRNEAKEAFAKQGIDPEQFLPEKDEEEDEDECPIDGIDLKKKKNYGPN